MGLIELKKRFYEVYGHVDEQNNSLPEFVKFMVFDTDVIGTRTKSRRQAVNSVSGEVFPVEFTPAEVIPMGSAGCDDYVKSPSNAEEFDWVPLENKGLLNALNELGDGAGQIRLFGRIGMWMNFADVRNAVSKAINEVKLARYGNDYFEPLVEDELSIYIVSSLGGGTGAGMFMDMGILLRDILDEQDTKASINGYFVLPDIFWKVASPQDMKRVKPNTIGALKDLDFFSEMLNSDEAQTQIGKNATDKMTPIWDVSTSPLHEAEERIGMPNVALKYVGGLEARLTSKAYSNVYLIDSENRAGGTFDTVKDLAKTIAKGLFASITTVSAGLKSVDDNAKGEHYYNHKLGWVGSVGVSEVVYNLPEVKQHLAYRVLEKGLNQILSIPGNMVDVALGVLEESKLVEIGDRSELVQSIYKSTPPMSKSLYEDADPEAERNTALKNVYKSFEALQIHADAMLSNAEEKFSRLDAVLPDDGRLNARLELLKEMIQLVESFDQEIKENDEKLLDAEIERTEKELHQNPDSIEKRLENLLGEGMVMRMLKKREIEGERNSWEREMTKLMDLTKKKESMKLALVVLSKARNSLADKLKQAQKQRGELSQLQELVSSEIDRRNRSGITRRKASPFLLQLHGDDMNIPFDLQAEEKWNSNEFLLGLSNVLYDSVELSEKRDKSVQFVLEQNYQLFTPFASVEPADKTCDTLDQMLKAAEGVTNVEKSEIGQLIRDLMRMSSPMIKLDPAAHKDQNGVPLEQAMRKAFVICVPAPHNDHPLVQGIKSLAEQLRPPGQVKIKVQAVPDQVDRLTIYQRLTGAPVSAMAGFSADYQDYKRRHDRANGEVFHVNYNWVDAMDLVGYNLESGVSATGQRNLENWSIAFLLKFIQYDSTGKVWRIEPGESKAKAVVKDLNRIELYQYLMEECDYGEEIERMVDNLLRRTDPMAISKGLNSILYLDDRGGILKFRPKENDPKGGVRYFGDPEVNPYVDGRSATDIYGESSYKRVDGGPESLELLQQEGECLKELFKKER